jgi:hypothetical protein
MDTVVENSHEGVDAVAAKMLTDPVAAFDASYARMHAIPRDRLEAIQLAGLKIRNRLIYGSLGHRPSTRAKCFISRKSLMVRKLGMSATSGFIGSGLP